MRMNMGPHQLRIVGKGWQVRAILRQLSRHPITLHELLLRRQKSRP
jgi:hypothetical protein